MRLKFLFYSVILSGYISAQTHLPKPDHILIVMFQNHAFDQIVNATAAPYINSLIADTNTALLTQSYALSHPSQPNYLQLYSGSNQGVTDDNIPTNTPFHNCNLGASLLAASKTFVGYSESMPSVGYLGTSTSLYYRKHNPWSDWQGTGLNTVPDTCNQPFSNFPQDYALLPDVSFVVGNIINCMHDGTIQQGDTWLHDNLDAYIQWAKTHNSLFILTFDEDNNAAGNRITTFFIGPMVAPGSYSTHVTHYNLLRTIEDIYGLPACANSSLTPAIDFVFKSAVGIKENTKANNDIRVWSTNEGQLFINAEKELLNKEVKISITDLSGRTIFNDKRNLLSGENIVDINYLKTGIYLLNISGENLYLNKKISKQ